MALPRHVCHFDRGQQRYGVVTIEDGKFICLTCCKPSCCHTAYFNTLKRSKCELPEFLQAMVHTEVDTTEPGKPKTDCDTPKAISRKKIPFERSTALASVLNMDICSVVNKDATGKLQLEPPECCPYCGNSTFDQPFLTRRNNCKLFFHSRIIEAMGKHIYKNTFI